MTESKGEPMKIRNTTRAMREDPAEPLLALAEGMVTGSPTSFIERQERDGQAHLVNSDRLPSDMGDQAGYEALGFTFGEPDGRDPMFRPATLPDGWRREGGDHAMWSYLLDEHGRRRVSIFYKAAFYDRSAHMYLSGLSSYVRDAIEYDGTPLVLDDKWATREAVREAMLQARQHHLDQGAEWGERTGGPAERYVIEHAESVAKYDAAIGALGDD